MRKIYALLFTVVLFVGAKVNAQVVVTGCTGAGNGSYTTLSAAATAIVATQTAAVINITVAGTTAEPVGGATFVAGTWVSLTIQPTGGAGSAIVGAATAGSPLISFNGSDNVTINGLNTGGNSLIIENTMASATSNTSTIRRSWVLGRCRWIAPWLPWRRPRAKPGSTPPGRGAMPPMMPRCAIS